MKKVIAAVLSSVVLLSGVANASLIKNGSFEENTVNAGGWSSFSANQVNGWSGDTIEIWNNLNGFAAFDGSQHIELNSDNTGFQTIFQNFASEAGQTYSLEFAYAARENLNESFKVEVLDAATNNMLFSQNIEYTSVRQWDTFSTIFAATSDFSQVRFTSLNRGSKGNLIDAVSVAVPEPGSIGLIALGLLALSGRRKFKA
ncbi:DUF642 domain-containing protein [Salinimonas chungwhensis]|uniref:DUF642 domain-containing protein n=1 Tax=Salinimonas chungwhensis TaxID=265425 RepID=UPI000364FAC9|nr:DUF642 domain-containing protein [Salinimonas chungwhensis]